MPIYVQCDSFYDIAGISTTGKRCVLRLHLSPSLRYCQLFLPTARRAVVEGVKQRSVGQSLTYFPKRLTRPLFARVLAGNSAISRLNFSHVDVNLEAAVSVTS